MTEAVAACIGIDRARTYVIHTHIVHGEVVLLLLLQMLLQLKEMVVADRPHGHIGNRAGRRRHHIGHHQLLVRKEGGLGAAGNGEEAAPIPLVLAALLLLEPLQPLLPSILL
jgi:hypothetical protein